MFVLLWGGSCEVKEGLSDKDDIQPGSGACES